MKKLHFYDREDRPWPNQRLTNAAIIGHTTTSTSRLWIRVWEPGLYWLIVSETPIRTLGKPKVEKTGNIFKWKLELEAGTTDPLDGDLYPKEITYESDLTAVFDLNGLKPGTRYYFAVFSDLDRKEKWEIGHYRSHSFRTQLESPKKISFGLFSCHMPYKGRELRNMEMWDRFNEELKSNDADFIIGAGDQVYVDGNKHLDIWSWLKKINRDLSAKAADQIDIMKSWYRDIYRGYWGPLPVQKVFRSFPTYMIWDDHEIMDGWGSYTSVELSKKLNTVLEDFGQNNSLGDNMLEAATQVYVEYQHSHNPDTPMGQYDYAFSCGNCAFYVLDMRGNRDYERTTTGEKILGPEQMKRFLQWLKKEEVQNSDAIFIVSPVPIVHVSNFVANTLDIPLLGIADDLRDTWEHESNWAERNQILDEVFQLSQTTTKRVIFLSGDVHVGAAFKLLRENSPNARIYQLTSSAITHASIPYDILKFAMKNAGELGTQENTPPEKRTAFHKIHHLLNNNFGIVSVVKENGEVDIIWTLYGRSQEEGAIVKLKQEILA